MNYDELIVQKTEELNQKVRIIQQMQSQIQTLNTEAVKLDGAINMLKELKGKEVQHGD